MSSQLRFVLFLLGALILAAVVSFAATPLVKSLAFKVGAVDVPKDNRRMHKVPIPRLGGLAIFLAFMFSVLLFADIDREIQGILLGAVMIVVLGVLDDILTLQALPKFAVQILAAVVVVLHGVRIEFLTNPIPHGAATYLVLPLVCSSGKLVLSSPSPDRRVRTCVMLSAFR